MKSYVGTKIIQAEPMDKKEFDIEQGKIPERTNKRYQGYKVIYPDGYISWSPKEVFEIAYREITQSEFKLIHL